MGFNVVIDMRTTIVTVNGWKHFHRLKKKWHISVITPIVVWMSPLKFRCCQCDSIDRCGLLEVLGPRRLLPHEWDLVPLQKGFTKKACPLFCPLPCEVTAFLCPGGCSIWGTFMEADCSLSRKWTYWHLDMSRFFQAPELWEISFCSL